MPAQRFVYDAITPYGTTDIQSSIIIYLEAMYIDKPMILLIPEQALYRDTEAEYIHALERVGVIQHDPVKAAAYVADVYDRIDEWWKEPERREAVNAVRERYITKVKDTDGWWFRELMKYC